MSETTDQLIHRALANDSDALTELVRRHFAPVYSVGLCYLRDREQAEDLAQEVFLRGWLGLPNLRQPDYFGTWLVSIARNLAATWRRRNITRSELVPLVPLDARTNEVVDSAPDPREHFQVREERAQLQRAIWALPDEQREIVLLHYAEGYSKSEIARLLGVHPSSVGRQLDKAIVALRAYLEPELRQAASNLRCHSASIKSTNALLIAASGMSTAAKAALAQGVFQGAAGMAVGVTTPVYGASSIVTKVFADLASGKAAIAVAVGVLVLGGAVTSRQWLSDKHTGAATKPPTARTGAVQVPIIPITKQRDEDRLLAARTTSGPSPLLAARKSGGAETLGTGARIKTEDTQSTIGVAVLSGRVIHATTGAPVDGVLVEVWRRNSMPRSAESPVRKALTDGSGYFIMEDMPEGEIAVTAETDKLRLHPPDNPLSDLSMRNIPQCAIVNLREGAPQDVEVRVSEGFTVTGIVRNRTTMAPVPGAEVKVRDGRIFEKTNSAVADENGEFTLTNVFGAFDWTNTMHLDVSAAGYRILPDTLYTGGIRGHHLPVDGNQLSGVELWLSPGVKISGRVIDEDGAPVARAILNLCTSSSLNMRPGCRADMEGEYSFDVLPHSEFILAIRRDQDHPTTLSQSFHIGGESMRVPDFVLAAPGRIAGVVRDEKGQPLSGVRIQASVPLPLKVGAFSTLMGEMYGSATTDDTGGFTLDNLPQGRIQLSSSRAGYPSVQLSAIVTEPPGDELAISMEQGYSVSGQVVDTENRPIAGARVAAMGQGKTVTSDAQGGFVLTGLRRGKPVSETALFARLANSIGASHPDHGYVQVHNVAQGVAGLKLQIGGENGPAVIEFQVVDGQTSQPIESATVSTRTMLEIVKNDDAGRWTAKVTSPGGPMGTYMLDISTAGYEPFSTRFDFDTERQLDRVFALQRKQ